MISCLSTITTTTTTRTRTTTTTTTTTNEKWPMMIHDNWQHRCARGREGKMLHQEAGKKTDQLRWSMIIWCQELFQELLRVYYLQISDRGWIRVFKSTKETRFPPTGSSELKGPQCHSYQNCMFFFLKHIWEYFFCFRDGGKRFDAEFQGSHHQIDKQEISHMWYQNENKSVKWTKWMYNPRWSGFCGGSWETSSKPNLWSFAGSSKDLP